MSSACPHDGLIHSIIKRYHYLPSQREDLVQEGRIGVLIAQRRHRPELAAFTTYATLCIRSRINNYLRRDRPGNEIASDIIRDYRRDYRRDDGINDSDTHTILLSVLDKLPERNKEIIILRYYESLSCDDIGIRLGLSRQRVHQIEQCTLIVIHKRLHATSAQV